MSQVQTAAMLLAAVAVGLLLVVAIIRYQRRRNAKARALEAPFDEGSETSDDTPRAARPSKFSRKPRVEEPPVEMAPGRLARISAKSAADRVEVTDADESSFEDDSTADPMAGEGYDIADTDYHPADWDMMVTMVTILESRLDLLTAEGSDPANVEARNRAEEIIAIVRDSAGAHDFSPPDAASVMSALQAIRWTTRAAGDEEGAPLTLTLTRHHPGAKLWVHEYHRALLDHKDAAADAVDSADALVDS